MDELDSLVIDVRANTAGFTADIASWLQARADWPSLRAHARATVEPYTLEAMAEALLGLYRRLLG